ncbi:uncharacterized protein LOC123405731, partial [Hordeum vulgare subsp. vulgare]|uniref:uncharacterized protein LOC123405731 n=1 Tax=Hordeum vulgare subsp. vulgare TaxID=112509 RepID=UPI001D1A4293
GHRRAVAGGRPRRDGVQRDVEPPEREPLAVALRVHVVLARREHPRDHPPLHRLPVADAGVPEPAVLHAPPPPREALVPLGPVGALERHRVADLPREHLLHLGPGRAGRRQAGSAHRGVVLQRAREPRLPSPAVQPRRLVLVEEQDGGARAAHQPEEVGQRAADLVAEQPGLSSVSVHVLVATGLGAGSAGAGGMTARPGD